jgi:hypothetical protein
MRVQHQQENDMSNYAPGSWAVQGVEIVANHAGESFRVATVHGDHEPNWNGRMHIAALQATARLIAAAPDMYALLQDVVALLNDPDADGFEARRVERKILDILDKVEGA